MTFRKILLPLFLFFGTIIAFVFSFIKPNLKSSEITSPNKKSNASTIDDPTPTISNPQNFQKLSVLPLKCIGCGKCARIDSSHFEMNYNTSKAIVISSTNLNSPNLISAINICPVSAITLN